MYLQRNKLTLMSNSTYVMELSKMFIIQKFLGVIIDDKLSWKDHIRKMKDRLSKCTLQNVLIYTNVIVFYY